MLYITTASHLNLQTLWTHNEGGGCQSGRGEIYIPPGDPLLPFPLPSLTLHFLLLLLLVRLYLCGRSPYIVIHTYFWCQLHTHIQIQDGLTVLRSKYYSEHPKGRNPVTPLLFNTHKRPIEEGAGRLLWNVLTGSSIMTCLLITHILHMCVSLEFHAGRDFCSFVQFH